MFFFFFFFFFGGGGGLAEKRGSKYHCKQFLNSVSLACRLWPNMECWIGSFVIFQGIRTSIAKEPYIFVFYQGGPDPLYLPLDLRML